jgi:dephospho-CoA kinase
MKKIVITGNQGSGKSFITREFSKLGVPTLMIDNQEIFTDTLLEN